VFEVSSGFKVPYTFQLTEVADYRSVKHLIKELTKDRACDLANEILLHIQCIDELPDTYISAIVYSLLPLRLPDEIGLKKPPEKIVEIARKYGVHPYNDATIDDIWEFLSRQVEIVSSFVYDGNGIILNNFKRRSSGTYITPPNLGKAIASLLIHSFLERTAHKEKDDLIQRIKTVKILDPASSTGNLLFEVVKILEKKLTEMRNYNTKGTSCGYRRILIENCIFGVDKDPIAIKVARFLFWLYSLDDKGGVIPDFRVGDSLTGMPFHSPSSRNGTFISPDFPSRFDWNTEYKGLDGFTMIISNPPWEKIKIMTRDSLEKKVSWSKATRAEIERELNQKSNGHIRKEIELERDIAKGLSDFFRNSGLYPLSAKGDINLYALFVERCNHLLCQNGIAALIVPTGLVTDYYLKELFGSFVQNKTLIAVHDFINQKKYFRNIDGRYRYSFILFSREPNEKPSFKLSFYNRDPNDIRKSMFYLNPDKIEIFNPLTKTLIIPKNRRFVPLLLRLHTNFPILAPGDKDQSSWKIVYRRKADMTNDSHLFESTENIEWDPKNSGILLKDGKKYLRVYEGKMVDRYNHRAGSTATKKGQYRRSGLSIRPSIIELKNPRFLVKSRYAISLEDLKRVGRLRGNLASWHLAFKEITSATNRRTMRAAILPKCVASNKLPTLEILNGPRAGACMLGVLNSIAFDFICRQKIGNITLNWYILRQIPVPPLEFFLNGTVNGERIIDWLVKRVIKLCFTSIDLKDWSKEVGGPTQPYTWDESTRRELMTDIDALMFHLYKFSREEINLILKDFPSEDTKGIVVKFDAMEVQLPGKTF
jgi:hypothetical protein